MRGTAIALACACLTACSQPGSWATPVPSLPPPSLAGPSSFDRVYGSYQTGDGDLLIVARMGWFADLRDGTYRSLYQGDSSNRFTVGPGFRVPGPTAAVLDFGDGRLRITRGGRTVTADPVQLKRTDITIPASNATLAATITEPLGAEPHPGIVIVHGSEPGQRSYYDFWVGLYTSLGLTVLTYDKRGQGDSTGRYPGEYPTDRSLGIYADDASAALAFLATWPGVDRHRVGFHGGSQGGWTVPLAIARHGRAAFAILVSAPAVTVDQQAVWSDFSHNGAVMPAQSEAEMEAAVRAEHGGYDPAPALASLGVPALWLLGRNDRTVPTAVSSENLSALKRPNFHIQLVTSGHGLLLNQSGLNADDERAPGLAPEVIPSIRDWLQTVTA